MTTAVGWAPIIKSEKTADGTLIITGKAADSTLDRDYQIADPAWLDQALGKWYGEPDGGNVREQHNGNRAIGTAVHYEKRDDGGHYVTAEIVDPVAILKIEKRVLKGFSWSARNAATKSDPKAPGGRIVKGDIYELSVVDRPANPGCLISIAKADDAGDLLAVPVDEQEFVEVTTAAVEKADDEHTPRFSHSQVADAIMALGRKKNPAMASVAKADDATRSDGDSKGDGEKPGHKPARYKNDPADTVKCPACGPSNAPHAKHCDQCGDSLKGKQGVEVTQPPADSDDDTDVDASKSDIAKKDMDPNVGSGNVDRDKLAASDFVFGDERVFPIVTKDDVSDAVSSWGRYEGKHTFAQFRKNLTALAKRKGFEDELPAKWTDTKKAVDAARAVAALLAERGVDLSKADDDAFDPDTECDDVNHGLAAIAAIAALIVSEAEGLAAGRMEEVWDIQLLCQAAMALQSFVSNETYQEAALMTDTGKADDGQQTETADTATQATEPVSVDTDSEAGKTTDKSDATEETEVGVLSKAELSALLDDAITKARKPLEDELALVKADLAQVLETPRPDGPARTRTTTHTAAAAKADTMRTEIARLRDLIQVTDGDIQKGYRTRLADAEAELTKLVGAAA